MALVARYDFSYEPPAPVFAGLVGPPGSTPVVAVNALADSGADISVLPRDLAQLLQLPVTGTIALAGFGSAVRDAEVRAAAVQIDGRTYLAEVACVGTEPLWGRNLLKYLVMTLDGPGESLQLRSP